MSHVPNGEGADLSFVNASGDLVLKANISDISRKIEISDQHMKTLKEGLYFVKITTEQQSFTKKLIIEK